MSLTTFVCHDWETGGLDPRKAACAQVALVAIRSDTFEEIARYESYIKPYGLEYHPQALASNGLTVDLLESKGQDIRKVTKEMAEFFAEVRVSTKRDGKPMLVAHNAQFDNGFFQNASHYGKTNFEKVVDGNTDFYGNYQPKYVDTVKMSVQKWGASLDIKHNLEACCERAGIDLQDAHDAMNDTVALKELFIYFCTSMRSGGSTTQKGARFRDKFQFEY